MSALGHKRTFALQKGMSALVTANVRFGSKADMCNANRHVRFTPNSGHVQCNSACLICTISGHLRRRTTETERPPRAARRGTHGENDEGCGTGLTQKNKCLPVPRRATRNSCGRRPRRQANPRLEFKPIHRTGFKHDCAQQRNDIRWRGARRAHRRIHYPFCGTFAVPFDAHGLGRVGRPRSQVALDGTF